MANKAKKAERGVPYCTGGAPGEGGGKEYELTLNEIFTKSLACHECGTRFPLEKVTERDWRSYGHIPPHKIPETLHEYRKKQEREEHASRSRSEVR
jgi:hypothetical protein